MLLLYLLFIVLPDHLAQGRSILVWTPRLRGSVVVVLLSSSAVVTQASRRGSCCLLEAMYGRDKGGKGPGWRAFLFLRRLLLGVFRLGGFGGQAPNRPTKNGPPQDCLYLLFPSNIYIQFKHNIIHTYKCSYIWTYVPSSARPRMHSMRRRAPPVTYSCALCINTYMNAHIYIHICFCSDIDISECRGRGLAIYFNGHI